MKPIRKILAVLLLVSITFVFAKPLDDNQVAITNNYTRDVTCTLNYASSGTQNETVNQGSNLTSDIGTEAVVSITIWGQTVPVGQNSIVQDPIGGHMKITFGYGALYEYSWDYASE